MAPKQPSKQKRAAQNRQQRAALEARRANAHAEAAASGSSGGPVGGSGSLLSRLRGGGGGGTRSQASGRGARPSMSEARSMQPPGYRAALSAVFAAVAAILLCSFALRYPVSADGDLYTTELLHTEWVRTATEAVLAQPDATPAELVSSIDDWMPGREKQTVVQALWPFSLAIALPLIGAGIAFYAVRKRAGSKVVNRALYATLFGAVLTQGLLLLFLPVVLAVGVAMFQVRKAEAVAAAQAGGDGVIDVDEVDDAEVDDDELDDPVQGYEVDDSAELTSPGVIDAEVVDEK